MPPLLKYIEINNFKSYRGRVQIGPLAPLNAVIGPNGSGKSNFMDAISFVMGDRTTNLRVKRLSDLIHGASINRPISRRASVSAVFEVDNEEKTFERSIVGSSLEHHINGEIVKSSVYIKELAKLSINVKAKNFLVYQGQVESIAMKTPKEITKLFEEISGSGAFKEEYDKLKKQMEQGQEDLSVVHQQRKGVYAARKIAKEEKEEADKYARLLADLNNKLVEHQLFLLFHNERETERLAKELIIKQNDVHKLEGTKEDAEKVLKDKKKTNVELIRRLAKTEQDIREMEVEISKKYPNFIAIKEKVVYIQQKLDADLKTLNKAKKAHETHYNDIAKLEQELEDIEKRQSDYASELESQGLNIQLEEEQVKEYHQLKKEVAKRSAGYIQKLDSKTREQKSNQDQLDNLVQMRTEAKNKHQQKLDEKEEMKRRIDKLADCIGKSEEELVKDKQNRDELQNDVESSREKVTEIQKQLEETIDQISDARVDKHEDARKKKKQQIIDIFKTKFHGVYDRIINICQPIHQRYNIAVTKVLGKHMQSIVVDTEETARKCIHYLKVHRLEPETFLPLNYIRVKRLKERLRNIQEPEGVKLLFDVINFEPNDVEKAIFFATNNTLVCETPEDAQKVAYELDANNFHDAVALDGTFYHKSGLISGGSTDLAKKAKCWDEKYLFELEHQKEKLTDELREALKTSRKESELKALNLKINGLETRLRYFKHDLETINQQIETVDNYLVALSGKILNFAPKMTELERSIKERGQDIEKIEVDMNRVEDIVFASFCQQIGVENIRQYEDHELRMQEERKQKRLEFQKQINLVINNLEFEKSRDTQSNVSRWEKAVENGKKDLQKCKDKEAKLRLDMDKDLNQVEVLKSEKLTRQVECDKMEEEIGKSRREVASISKDVDGVRKIINVLEGKIENMKSIRYSILKQCKMDSISIPLSIGNMDDIVEPGSVSGSTETDSTVSQFDRASRIQIQYDTLPRDFKNIERHKDVEKKSDELLDSIKKLQVTIDKTRPPDMKALQKLEQTQEKIQSTNETFSKLRKENKDIASNFERVKSERYKLFTTCFDKISSEIDDIYKRLTNDQSAQALLSVENPEEPYLDGVTYNCVAPGKRFQLMSSLSGGEKTIAALALLFAIHNFQPSPFFVLDEVDASLDNTNIGKVVEFINQRSCDLQTIVISLKDETYSTVDLLIGVTPLLEPAECLVSDVITLNLSQFQRP